MKNVSFQAFLKLWKKKTELYFMKLKRASLNMERIFLQKKVKRIKDFSVDLRQTVKGHEIFVLLEKRHLCKMIKINHGKEW